MARKAGKMQGITIGVVGGRELQRALQQLESKTRARFARQGMRKGMKLVLAEARAKAPVRTGRLKKSLRIKAAKRRKKATISIRLAAGEGDFKGDTFYGSFLEYGYHATPRYPLQAFGEKIWVSGKRGSTPTKWMPPRPFMRPALDNQGPKAIEVAAAEIWRLMAGYASKVAAKGKMSRALGRAAMANPAFAGRRQSVYTLARQDF
jgi:HK97 gp10 family phage protein